MLENVKNALLNECEVSQSSKLLVGVSGGADSLGLLHALHHLGLSITAAHFNHNLRNAALGDAEFVQGFAEKLGVDFVMGEGDTEAFADENKMSVEEAARELRYKFLFSEAERLSASEVVVAHTADDQVETVLMHLLRGSGLDGLCGMRSRWLTPWHAEIPLIRPLLGVWKDQIIEYCEYQGLSPRFDRSNLDTTYFRNRIRHELLPVLASFNPNASKLVLQTANILSRDQHFLETSVDEIWQNLVLENTAHGVAFKLDTFNGLHLAIKRRILRKAISELRPDLRNIGFSAIEDSLNLIEEVPTTARMDLLANLFIQVEADRVIVGEWDGEMAHPDFPQLLSGELLLEGIPGEYTVGRGWELSLALVSMLELSSHEIFKNPDPFTTFLDYSTMEIPLRLRIRQAGDRFQPLGMGEGSANLADFMINEKIPTRARKHWPLLCANEEIVWVPGVRVGDPFKVTDNTEQVLKIRLLRKAR